MKRKLLSVVLICAMIVCCLPGCGSGSKSSSSDKKVLRVGMECAYAPFNWTQESENVADGSKAVKIYGSEYYAYGYDVAVAQMIADKLGMELEVHKVEWDSIGISLDAGDYDCIIAGMGYTPARAASYNFCDIYYYRDDCFVALKGSGLENCKTLADMADKKVTTTTQLGTGWVEMCSQVPNATIGANYETTSECIMAVQNGVATAALLDVPTALTAQKSNPDLVVVKISDLVNTSGTTDVHIAVRKDDTELHDKINQAMKDLNWTGNKTEMNALMDKMVDLAPSAN
ncbi:MAG: transporter substrate-binding domain-containing protein [Lachnospira sp.]